MVSKQWLVVRECEVWNVWCEVGLRLVSSSNHGCFEVWGVGLRL